MSGQVICLPHFTVSLDESCKIALNHKETIVPALAEMRQAPEVVCHMATPPYEKADQAELFGDKQRSLMRAVADHRSKAAFEQLFDYFAPRLKAYVMRAGASAQMADEITQEAMIAVWQKADRYDPSKASVATWVFTIVRNKRIDFLRREARPDLKPEDFLHEDDRPVLADEHVESSQESIALKRLIKTLPDEQAQVIKMAYFEDKSHRIISEELGLPLGTVKSRIRLALLRVKSAMMEQQS